MTSDRMASSLARPPAFRITWASPSARPAYFAGSRRASIQARIAKWRLGGSGRLPLSPKFSAYFAFAASTSSRILLIGLASCSELSQRIAYQENMCGAEPPSPCRSSSAAEPPHERHGLALPDPCPESRSRLRHHRSASESDLKRHPEIANPTEVVSA